MYFKICMASSWHTSQSKFMLNPNRKLSISLRVIPQSLKPFRSSSSTNQQIQATRFLFETGDSSQWSDLKKTVERGAMVSYDLVMSNEFLFWMGTSLSKFSFSSLRLMAAIQFIMSSSFSILTRIDSVKDSLLAGTTKLPVTRLSSFFMKLADGSRFLLISQRILAASPSFVKKLDV